MDGILQRVVSIIIAVAIFFILPVYIAYEKKMIYHMHLH